LSKRLKRRIHDICGLSNLSREDRVRKAQAILDDSDYKQKVCNQIVGASHRDVYKALKSIVDAVQLSPEQEEQAELERDHPEKLDPTEVAPRKSKPVKMVPVTDQREVTWLMNASTEPLKEEPRDAYDSGPGYSQEEIEALIAGSYDPTNFDRYR
jgi:hypothetical protein